MAKKACPMLHELAPVDRGGQEVVITKPSFNFFGHLCIRIRTACLHFQETYRPSRWLNDLRGVRVVTLTIASSFIRSFDSPHCVIACLSPIYTLK